MRHKPHSHLEHASGPEVSDRQHGGLSFSALARNVSWALGSPIAFAAACGVILVWLLSGFVFSFSDTWQLLINTGTTIVTFLMVFLVQNTQNHDALALHLKLDELLRSIKSASNTLIDLENCTDEELEAIERQFKSLRKSRAQPERASEAPEANVHS